VSDAGLEGLLFDGRTAAATPVLVTVAGGVLRVSSPDGAPLREAALATLAITEPLATAPRQVQFPDGASVEVADGSALTVALAGAGIRPGLVDRLQQRWAAALGALVASAALLAGAYAWGLPAAVRVLASAMPARAEERLGEGVLDFLDRGFLRPTALSEPERAEVERVIGEAARRGAPGVRYRLLFRSMAQKPDVNAFALPGGTVVLLDGLVRRAGASDRLVAVVGHELGHVARRHSTRSFLRAAGIGVVTSMLWGDISGQAATIPAVMAMLDYSRDAEREADDDAVRFLRAAGLSPRAMHDAFCLLAAVERKSGLRDIPRILSSHPGLDERLARVRALGAPGEVPQACEAADAADAAHAAAEDEDEAGDEPATCAPGGEK